MPNNINSSIFNSSCSQYQSQRSTSANLQCQQQENSTQPASTKNEQVISDTKPYTSPSSDTPSSALNITSRPIKEKTLPCGYPGCDKTFSCNSKLDRHQRIHTGEKPYKCSICPKDFIQKGDLTRHERSHTEERHFKCTDCSKEFILKHHLNQHKRVHTGERPFKCIICDQVFTQIGSLNRHKSVHKGKKTNKCTIYDKVLNRLDKLNRHLKTNHIQNNQTNNYIREFIKNCNDDKKKILEEGYNSIFKQCQDKSISIEETLMNLLHGLTKKYMFNDDVQNVADKLVSIITQLPPQFKSTSCLDIRDEEITSYAEIVFILKKHTVDEFFEKYLKIEIPQSGDNQDLSTKKRTRSDSLNDDETILGKKVKSAHEIKIEPSSELTLDIDGLQITSTSKIIQAHNNSLPILHAPGDDTKDLMPESENTVVTQKC